MSQITVENIKRSTETASRSARGVAAVWVNFNGTGTVAIRDSENVASLTDLGVGRYRVTYTNNMSGDYSTTGAGNTGVINIYGGEDIAASLGTYVTDYSGVLSDAAYVLFTIHGDLA